MKRIKEFPFERSRRGTSEEVEAARKAIEAKLGVKRPLRGRPPKKQTTRYKPISIRLHPKVLYWAKQQAKRRGIGYQTIVNEALLKLAA
jgi:uncharacterized protein (DUF4415 family)